MNILAITQNTQLLDRLRAAFEGAGHELNAVPDHLEALVGEAWNRAHLILVEAKGDPMDGYRLCHLLRAEPRALFRALPIFMILEHPPWAEDRARLLEVDGDGFVETNCSIQRLLKLFGPLLEGALLRGDGPPVPLVGCDLTPASAKRIREGVEHYGFSLQLCASKALPEALAQWQPPILFQGLGRSADQALESLRSLSCLAQAPYPVLVGNIKGEAQQRQLLTAGTMDWLTLPLSVPMVLHVLRKAMAWRHAKRVQQECQLQIHDLVERRVLLEMEASALRSEVVTDSLTELLNRRAFDQNLEHAVNQWQRHHRAFVLVLGDLDYFKLINDRFGHQVGDQVLKAVAQRIRESLRRSDLAFRIGGEEFAVLLSETILAAGVDVAEKIRRRIYERPVTLDSGQCVFPTMSFGVGGPEEENPDSLFRRVDEALYAAKRKGRNRVEVMGNQGV